MVCGFHDCLGGFSSNSFDLLRCSITFPMRAEGVMFSCTFSLFCGYERAELGGRLSKILFPSNGYNFSSIVITPSDFRYFSLWIDNFVGLNQRGSYNLLLYPDAKCLLFLLIPYPEARFMTFSYTFIEAFTTLWDILLISLDPFLNNSLPGSVC